MERRVVASVREADPAGPTEADLAAIEREWPLIEAELALVDAEIRALTVVGGPSPLDWRRVRRAEQRVLRQTFAFVAGERRRSTESHVHDLNLVEVRMSDCEFGCKVWRCESCGEETVLHSPMYGCRVRAA